jgi:hypothetical protein
LPHGFIELPSERVFVVISYRKGVRDVCFGAGAGRHARLHLAASLRPRSLTLNACQRSKWQARQTCLFYKRIVLLIYAMVCLEIAKGARGCRRGSCSRGKVEFIAEEKSQQQKRKLAASANEHKHKNKRKTYYHCRHCPATDRNPSPERHLLLNQATHLHHKWCW